MNNPTNNQRIEENFRTFNDKYVELFTDIKKGLEAMGSLHAEHINALQGIITSLDAANFSQARERLLDSDLSALVEESFDDNLKINSDITSLRIRMANLNLLEADASHYL